MDALVIVLLGASRCHTLVQGHMQRKVAHPFLSDNHRLQSRLHVGAVTFCDDVRIVQCSVPEETTKNLGRTEDASTRDCPSHEMSTRHTIQNSDTPRRRAVVSLAESQRWAGMVQKEV